MASETVEPIDWSHPPSSWAVPPELHVLHCVNAADKSQDLLHQPGLEREVTGMPDQHTTYCAATQGTKLYSDHNYSNTVKTCPQPQLGVHYIYAAGSAQVYAGPLWLNF